MVHQDDASFIALFVAHPVPMWVYELDGNRFMAVNTAAITHYGYSESEFLEMTILDIRPPDERQRLSANLEQPPHQAIEKSGIWRHLRKDGSIIDVDITSHPIWYRERGCKFVLAHDVTERLAAQRKVTRLNRLYAVLSSINSAIVRTKDRATLFGETCRIATGEGEFVCACIAELDAQTLDAVIVAQAGADSRLPGLFKLTARANLPHSAWPASRALRENIPVICDDLGANPYMASLLGQAAEPAAKSMAAFPLTIDKRVVGVLMLFAAATDCFDEAEFKLLNELAGDVSFALQFIEQEDEHKRIIRRLRESEAGLRRAQITNKSAHVIAGTGGSFESWSETLPSLIGVQESDMPTSARQWMELVVAEDLATFRKVCIQAGRSRERLNVEYRVRRPDGVVVHLRHTFEPLPGDPSLDGRERWFNTIQDVTEQTQQQNRIARLIRIYAVSSGINAAIARVHTRDALYAQVCRIAVHEGAFEMAWIGVLNQETLDGEVVASCGGDPDILQRIRLTARADAATSARPACTALREMRTVICNDIAKETTLAPLSVEWMRHGHHAVAALPLISAGRAVAVIVLCSHTKDFFDAEEIKLLDEMVGDLNFALQSIDNEERLSYLAYYDALTGIANGKLFEDRLTQFIHAAKTNLHAVGVILINVDRFSQLNDALGRHTGDLLLRQIAKRLDVAFQGGCSVARIGGATFAVAISELPQNADIAQMLEQNLFSQFNLSFHLESQDLRISARAGLALYPSDGTNAETLLKHAEVALRNAKTSGERYMYYSPAMNAAHATRLALETELRRALDQNEFVVYYQPRVDLTSGLIVSAEALIRWQHPQRGLIFPGTFIPLAEEIGLIEPISDWVLDAVCAQQASWLQRSVEIVPVAVNLSAVQFKNGKVVQAIPSVLEKHGLQARHVEFELTESMVMHDPDEAARNLQALKSLGTKISLDDFGTGYSSLAYLQRFPFDFVKIDRAFITDVTTNPGNAAIATAIIAMAHSLHLRVVAEGVETEGQLAFLRKRRCDEIQGFYFSPAVPAAEFEAMLLAKKQLTRAQLGDDDIDTLLIVDDEPNNLSALKRLFRREGYRILTAAGGQEGLDLLAVNRVQVIISDQRMPGMSGTQFLSVAKELYPDTIRMILSGYTDLAVVTESVNLGAVLKFMTKPWDDDDLKANIRDAFRRQRKGR